MTDSFTATSGAVDVLVAGVVKFATEAKPGLAIPGTITLTGYSIVFPDFVDKTSKTTTSSYYTGPNGSQQFHQTCVSYMYIAPAEYGPEFSGYHNLPDIDLGALPVGTDYLDITVNLTRTAAPPDLYTDPTGATTSLSATPWPCEIALGQYVQLDGQSVMIEHCAGMSRMLAIVIVDVAGVPHAMLRRKQSVSGDSDGFGPAGILHHVIDSLATIDSTAPSCRTGDSYTYGSTYTGSITIVPCRHTAPA